MMIVALCAQRRLFPPQSGLPALGGDIQIFETIASHGRCRPPLRSLPRRPAIPQSARRMICRQKSILACLAALSSSRAGKTLGNLIGKVASNRGKPSRVTHAMP